MAQSEKYYFGLEVPPTTWPNLCHVQSTTWLGLGCFWRVTECTEWADPVQYQALDEASHYTVTATRVKKKKGQKKKLSLLLPVTDQAVNRSRLCKCRPSLARWTTTTRDDNTTRRKTRRRSLCSSVYLPHETHTYIYRPFCLAIRPTASCLLSTFSALPFPSLDFMVSYFPFAM